MGLDILVFSSESAWGPAPTTTAATTFPGHGSGGGTSVVFARPAYVLGQRQSSGGAYASQLGSPILLVRASLVPASVTTYLRANLTSVVGSALVGGAGVVAENVRASLEGTLNATAG